MPGSLDTTNTMLAIIAAVSVLQGLVLIGVGVAGWKLYKTATQTMHEIDEKRVKPLVAKVENLVDKAHQLTDRVKTKADQVEASISHTVDRVDETAHRVRSNVTDTVHRVTDAVTGLRAALVNALTTEDRSRGNGSFRAAHDPLPQGTTGAARPAEGMWGAGPVTTDRSRGTEGGF